MKKRISLCTVIACVLSATVLSAQEVPMNETLKTIFSRKSVRAYTDELIAQEKLEMLAKAAMAAPTAVDKRPWEIIIVTDPATLRRLTDALPYAKMAEHAAAAIIVAGDLRRQHGGTDSLFWIMDCSAATENILLAAESLGLGAVWTAVYPDPGRVQAVQNILAMPAEVVPLNLIPVGVPKGDEQPKDKYNPAQLHWNKY